MPFYHDLKKEENKEWSTRCIEGIQRLRKQIKDSIPPKTLNQNLLISTWNLRDFSMKGRFGVERLPESLYYIAEIISSFDIVAVQEIQYDLEALRKLMKILGRNWGWIASDVNSGSAGNNERQAFIFDKRKVTFRNVVGELVPKGVRVEEEFIIPKAFARVPFLASFQSGWVQFTLCNCHIYYGGNKGKRLQRRLDEIDMVSKMLKDRNDRTGNEENFILLGDMNLIEPEHPGYRVLRKNGFSVPEKSIVPTNWRQTKYYDTISFIEEENKFEFADREKSGGVLNFYESVYAESEYKVYKEYVDEWLKPRMKPRPGRNRVVWDEEKKEREYIGKWRTFQISDHLPLWAELQIDFSDNYLKASLKNLLQDQPPLVPDSFQVRRYSKIVEQFSSKNDQLRVLEKLTYLRHQLSDLPSKTVDDTFLLATWNIRDFDSNKFGHGHRLEESNYYIAEIISAFDLVAVQEIHEDIGPLKRVMKILGDNYTYMVTDLTTGRSGNQERLGYIYDKRKVFLRNIVGEIVLPDTKRIKEAVDLTLKEGHEIEFTHDTFLTLPDGTQMEVKKGQTLTLPAKHHKITLSEKQLLRQRQFARTPFLVAFQAGWAHFSLCTVHIYFGDQGKKTAGYKRRVKEIRAIAEYLKDRGDHQQEKYKTSENYIILGDFNVVDKEDATYKALIKGDFRIPDGMYHFSNMKETAYYDQIAFRDIAQKFEFTGKSGAFDMFKFCFTKDDFETYFDMMENKELRDFKSVKKVKKSRTKKEQKEYYANEWRTWQLSDHKPLWVEMHINFSDAYLERALLEIKAGEFI